MPDRFMNLRAARSEEMTTGMRPPGARRACRCARPGRQPFVQPFRSERLSRKFHSPPAADRLIACLDRSFSPATNCTIAVVLPARPRQRRVRRDDLPTERIAVNPHAPADTRIKPARHAIARLPEPPFPTETPYPDEADNAGYRRAQHLQIQHRSAAFPRSSPAQQSGACPQSHQVPREKSLLKANAVMLPTTRRTPIPASIPASTFSILSSPGNRCAEAALDKHVGIVAALRECFLQHIRQEPVSTMSSPHS